MIRPDFLQLMGKGKRCWKHVRTAEDLRQLKEFEHLFVRNFRERPPGDEVLIPEVIHFIWLGPKEFPKNSRKNLEGWMKLHPGWRVLFWSDREHLLLPKGVERKVISDALLGNYKRLYEESDNFGERSDLIRYLVLHEIGGVYVDHDMECRISFSHLHRSYSFYGGLLTPGNPVIPRSAIVRNSIIGAKQGHTIVKRALELGEKRWDEVLTRIPGNDLGSVKRRVTLRWFAAFHDAVMEKIHEADFDGVIFPAGYFNEIEREFGLFAKEEMVGAWYTEEMSHHEEYLKQRMHRMMKRMHLYAAMFAVGYLLLFVFVILIWMKVI